MNFDKGNEDKAGRSYWDKTERNNQAFRAFAPIAGVRGFGGRMWHKAFEKALRPISGSDRKLLELGCGGSAYLPYFARQFGFQVYGIDYSERGCEIAREMCIANGVSTEIICADFFEAPPELLGKFDVVVSFGVLEHFTDTATALRNFAKFLRPGGVLMTTVPNMRGLTGLGQKWFSRDIFDVHEIIDTERLRTAHTKAGMTVLENKYFQFSNFGVINPGNHPSLLQRLFLSLLKATSAFVWAIESVLGPLPPNRLSSPYVFSLASLSKDRTKR